MKLEVLIAEIEKHTIPEQMILTNGTKITNCRKFIDSHVSILRGQPGKKVYLPYYNRLVNFYEILSDK